MTEQIKENINQLKQDLNETPVSKHKHKQIARELKEVEKSGFSQAIKLVFDRLPNLPAKIHWRVLLDLADFAKRESLFSEAQLIFTLIT